MTNECRSCHATTTNGLNACQTCRARLTVDLEFIPIYFRNLARWRPAYAGSRPVPGSRVLWMGNNTPSTDRIGDALDHCHELLTSWATKLEDKTGLCVLSGDTPAASVVVLCHYLTENVDNLVTFDWVGDVITGTHDTATALLSYTETLIPGWYAGQCAGCTTDTFVVPGLTWVTCRGCGRTTYARDHLDTILTEAGDWVATPKRLAEAVVALIDTETSVELVRDRIRHWGTRELIATYRAVNDQGTEVGPRKHTLGSVIGRIHADTQARRDKQNPHKATATV